MKKFILMGCLLIPGCLLAQETPEQKLTAQLKPLREKSAPLQQKAKEYFLAKDTAGYESIKPALTVLLMQIDSIEKDFILSNPDSDISLQLVQRAGGLMIVEKGLPLFNLLSDRLKNSEKGKAFKAKIDAVKSTATGKPAPIFIQNDVNGKPVSLAGYRGQYVLIDFWASWCVPCRKENPVLLAAYEKYRNKQFNILSVSIDQQATGWKKAIEEDKLPWTQVSDLNGVKNAAAVMYGVTAVPQNFLVDPEGIIVARNLRGNALEAKLAELLK